MSKRIIIDSKKNQVKAEKVTIMPTVDSLVDDALQIIAADLAYYRSKTSRGANLDLKEARVINNYADSLVKLKREMREASKADDFSNLSDAELLAIVNKLVNPLGALPPSPHDPQALIEPQKLITEHAGKTLADHEKTLADHGEKGPKDQ